MLYQTGSVAAVFICIGEDFSPRVRDVRKKLWPFVKEKRSKNERAAMVYDHIFMDGKKFTIGVDGCSTKRN